jgi:hypothetical protein
MNLLVIENHWVRTGTGTRRDEQPREPLRTATTPLVGREEEIELLMRRWAQAKAGDGRVILISGEPGIGRLRIAEAMQERLGAEPHTRLRFFCPIIRTARSIQLLPNLNAQPDSGVTTPPNNAVIGQHSRPDATWQPGSGLVPKQHSDGCGSALTPPASRLFRFVGLGYMVRPTALKEGYDILR